MLLGARQFFERRGVPTPPLPYDYEVEWIERDLSIDWTGGTSGNNTGFRFDEYALADESCSTTTRRMDVCCSASSDNFSLMISWLGNNLSTLSQRLGVWRKTTSPAGIATSFGSKASTLVPLETLSIDVFHTYSIVPDGTGNATYYLDGVLSGSASSTSTTKLSMFGAMFRYVSTAIGKCRVKRIRLGSDVYLIPVVKGNAVGFYNMVDGHMFLEEQACLSAGPRV